MSIVKIAQILKAPFLCVLFELVFAVLLLAFSADITTWITRIIGIGFILVALLFGYKLYQNRKNTNLLNLILNIVIAAGCSGFGLFLLISPDLLTGLMRIIIASLLIAVSLISIWQVWKLRRSEVNIHLLWLTVPVSCLIISLLVIFYQELYIKHSLSVILMGSAFLLHSLFEGIIVWFNKKNEDSHPNIELIDDNLSLEQVVEEEFNDVEEIQEDSEDATE